MRSRPGNPGSNIAADHVIVIDRSLAQIPKNGSRRSISSSEPIWPARCMGPPITATAAAAVLVRRPTDQPGPHRDPRKP